MKKVKFTFTEKVMLMEIMPSQDSINNLVIRRDLQKKLEPSQDEFKDNKFGTNKQGQSGWVDNGLTVDIELTEPEALYLKEKLQTTSDENKLDAKLIDIYQQIV